MNTAVSAYSVDLVLPTMAAAEQAIRAIKAIESLNKLMNLYDKVDEEPKIKKRRICVRSEDIENQLLKDIAWKNTGGDESFCPLTMENIKELCVLISSTVDINSLPVPSLSIRLRLAIALRYLVTGESHRLLEKISHVSLKSIQKIVPGMLRVLSDVLEKENLKLPNTQSEWKTVAEDFETLWKFPHTLGVLDARNFRVRCSLTETHSKSLILLSVLDAHSRFLHIEVIPSEENIYSKAYVNSTLYKSLKTKTLNIPAEKPLRGQTDKTPYFFVVNEIFGLDCNTLNVYEQNSTITRSQKAFNFRMKRVLLPAQMAFEILFFKFKVFHRLKEIDIDKAKLIIKTCCMLHNYLTKKLTQPLNYNDDLTKPELVVCDSPLPKQIIKSSGTGCKTRNNVCEYCVNEGDIPEQWQETKTD